MNLSLMLSFPFRSLRYAHKWLINIGIVRKYYCSTVLPMWVIAHILHNRHCIKNIVNQGLGIDF